MVIAEPADGEVDLKPFPCPDLPCCVIFCVPGQGVSSKPSANKAEAAQQLLLLYDAILNHLRQHGALVNAVKSEYLLEEVLLSLMAAACCMSCIGSSAAVAACTSSIKPSTSSTSWY